MKWRILFVLLLLSVTAVPAAEPVTPFHGALIKPSMVRLQPGNEQKFKVVIMATRLMSAAAPQSVKWSVNDIPGGNAELGTIDAQGLYRAPAKAPVPFEVHVCGEVQGSANRYVWGTVLLSNPAPAYKMIGTWGETTESDGRLKAPHGISIDLQGNLLLADQSAGRIFRYSKDGKFLAEIGRGQGSPLWILQPGGRLKLPALGKSKDLPFSVSGKRQAQQAREQIRDRQTVVFEAASKTTPSGSSRA
jgi:hypothetical protein